MNELKISKKDKTRKLIKQHESFLRCPYCQDAMLLKGYSLYCNNSHTFDIAKKGYLNFATSKGDDHYDYTLFEARKSMIKDGLFNKIEENICDIILKYTATKDKVTILDVGCGDGALLTNIHESLKQNSTIFFGLDLSKEAIALATNEAAEIGWLVGDLANIPLQSNNVDIILNIFSPANYAEFMRVLKPEGIVIKVVPLENHFKEVRDLSHTQTYLHSKTALIKATLEQHGVIQTTIRVSYKFPLTKQQRYLITTMSPLSKNMEEVVLNSDHVSVDVEIIVAKFNE